MPYCSVCTVRAAGSATSFSPDTLSVTLTVRPVTSVVVWVCSPLGAVTVVCVGELYTVLVVCPPGVVIVRCRPSAS